nr:zinc finger and BTB domain-containing protein 49-like [Labrus bergylta]
MSACCVSGCKNRQSSTSKLKFYRIPSGYRTFQANRRVLWLKAIQQVNGSVEGLRGNVRVCGAHFISGESSMDYDSPDFVPSVFTCTKQIPKKKTKRFMGSRKRRRRSAPAVTEDTTTQPGADTPADLQSSDLFEKTQTLPSPSVLKEEETFTNESENEMETETAEPQTSPCPDKTSPSLREPTGVPELGEKILTVILRRVFTPARGYQCELCQQTFTNVSELLKHRQLHTEGKSLSRESCDELSTNQADFAEHQPVPEPSFPCNMCERSFTTTHHLKRHKLLHVKDGRKCPICGVLFCQLHNHVLFLPQTESVTEVEEESSIIEPVNSRRELQKPKPITHRDDGPRSTVTVTPVQTTSQPIVFHSPKKTFKTLKPLPPPSHTRVLSEMPLPVLKKPYPVPENPETSSVFKKPYSPPAFSQSSLPRDIELPPSLQMFSPKFLTSSFFKVTRNYEYLLSKPRGIKKEKE